MIEVYPTSAALLRASPQSISRPVFTSITFTNPDIKDALVGYEQPGGAEASAICD